MKISIKAVITLLLTYTSTFVKAQDMGALYAQFQSSEILNKHFYGFSLYDIEKESYIMDIQADKYFTPASNAKIYTLYAGLLSLSDSIVGLQYIEQGDSLIIWGMADPSFLHSKLNNNRVFDFLKSTDKQLFLASSARDGAPFAYGWAIEDYDAYYQPEISTFPIYGNVATFRARQMGALQVVPNSFQNDLVFGFADGKASLGRDPHKNIFKGSNSRFPSGYVNEIPFITSDSLTASLLQDTLKRKVHLIHYAQPAATQEIRTLPTDYLYREMMLPSDNFLAEQIFLMSAYAQLHEFSAPKLRRWMEANYYQSLSQKIDLYDGSGLSAYNKVSPKTTVEILHRIYKLVPDEQALFRMFPSGGVDGTLRSAYALDLGKPFIWAKTGTITSVYNQSGFIRTRSGKLYIFSFLNNNFLEPTSAVRKEMVRIMTYLRKNY